MRIELKRISASAFQNLDVNQSVDLGPGLVSIIGVNQDDGGSNASGKSTITRAITAGLLGTSFLDTTNKEIRNRFLDEPPRVDLSLVLNGVDVLDISRVIGSKLQVIMNGQELTGKTDEIQQKLMDILKITPEQLNFLTNKSQGSFGGFLLMKDKDKKDFLGSFFNLTSIESGQERIQKKIKDVQTALNTCHSASQVIKAQLADTNEKLANAYSEVSIYSSPEFEKNLSDLRLEQSKLDNEVAQIEQIYTNKEVFESKIVQAQEYLEAERDLLQAKTNYDENYSVVNLQLSGIDKSISDVENKMLAMPIIPEELTTKLTTINKSIRDFHVASQQKRLYEQELQNKTNEQVSIQKHIDNLCSTLSCPTCNQKIVDEKFQELRRNATSKQEAIEASIKDVSGKLSAISLLDLSVLDKDRADVTRQISSIENSINKKDLQTQVELLKDNRRALSSMVNQYAAEIKSAEGRLLSTRTAIVNKIRSYMSDIKERAKAIKGQVDAKDALRAQANKAYAQVIEQITKYNTQVAVYDTKLATLLSEQNLLSKADDVLSRKGFIGYIFDSILEELNNEVNMNLKLIPNSYKFSLHFSSDSVAKTTGNVTKSINYRLYSGTDEVSFETLSGGEKLGLILSVDEALDTVLSRRLGVFMGWKVFDEQFMWVDEHSKEAILDFLRTKANNKCYIIIDHAGEFNSAIDRKITVTKSGGISRVSV